MSPPRCGSGRFPVRPGGERVRTGPAEPGDDREVHADHARNRRDSRGVRGRRLLEDHRGHGPVQQRADPGRCPRRRRRARQPLGGRGRRLLVGAARGDRWTVRRDQGTLRRVLDPRCRLQGRGRRVGEAGSDDRARQRASPDHPRQEDPGGGARSTPRSSARGPRSATYPADSGRGLFCASNAGGWQPPRAYAVPNWARRPRPRLSSPGGLRDECVDALGVLCVATGHAHEDERGLSGGQSTARIASWRQPGRWCSPARYGRRLLVSGARGARANTRRSTLAAPTHRPPRRGRGVNDPGRLPQRRTVHDRLHRELSMWRHAVASPERSSQPSRLAPLTGSFAGRSSRNPHVTG